MSNEKQAEQNIWNPCTSPGMRDREKEKRKRKKARRASHSSSITSALGAANMLATPRRQLRYNILIVWLKSKINLDSRFRQTMIKSNSKGELHLTASTALTASDKLTLEQIQVLERTTSSSLLTLSNLGQILVRDVLYSCLQCAKLGLEKRKQERWMA